MAYLPVSADFQAVTELAMLSTGANGSAQLVSETLRAAEGAVRPELLAALRATAAAVLPMDAVRESSAAATPPPAVVRKTMVGSLPSSAA